MRQAVFNRQPDLFDSTRITSVSLSNETERELMPTASSVVHRTDRPATRNRQRWREQS
jgi:hypothetical protein